MCGMLAAEDSSDPGVKTKVIALEKAWNQAYKLGDKNALADLLDDQVVLIDDGAMVSKSEFLRTIKPVHMAEQQLSPGTITVTVHGSSAIATGVFQSKGVEAGKKYARRERFLDTWVNKNGKWVCVAANATTLAH